MTFFIILTLVSIFYFVNSLYYSLSLLVFIILVLVYIACGSFMSSLTVIILSIVYIGAMIILIGYICAICPNVIVVSSFSSPVLIFFSSFSLYIYFSPQFFFSSSPSSASMVEYFYSNYGVFLFSIMIIMLFITLLIVTSQYLTPNGPFRSVS